MRNFIEAICVASAGYTVVFIFLCILGLLGQDQQMAHRFFVAFLISFFTLICFGSIHRGAYK